jgi:hypothetical protein
MTDYNKQAGEVLRVETESASYTVEAHERSVVAKAVRDYRERGIDTLLELDHKDGQPLGIVASTIVTFYVSTPYTRTAALLDEIREDEWEDAFRKANAAPEWERR